MVNYSDEQIGFAEQCIKSCNDLRDRKVLEDVLRHNLSSFLRLMFPAFPKWVELHIQGSEALVKFSRDTRKHRGFVDSLVGATAIEYESNLEIESKYKVGYDQVKEYCAGLLNQGYPSENIRGVLSDTVMWIAYDVEVLNEDVTVFSKNDLELIEIEKLDTSSQTSSAHLLLDFFEKHLGRIGSRILQANSLATDLGFDSSLAKNSLSPLNNAIEELIRNNEEYAQIIQEVWVKFVNSVQEKDQEVDFDLNYYIDEFYLITVAKCLCANFITGKALVSEDEELEEILNGAFFISKNFDNIVEYDFFGWLTKTPVHSNIFSLAKQAQLDLRAYDYSGDIKEDLFGGLLSQLASKNRRLLLGQEMTPNWLANRIVEKVINDLNDEPKFIDMCCGSGAFIVETIKYVINNDSNPSLNKLQSCIMGFDIDPLAVLLARINWVIITKPYQRQSSDSIHIPIYNADSLFAVTPVSTSSDNEDSFIIKVLDNEMELPKFLISKEYSDVFDRALNLGYSMISHLESLPDDDLFYVNILSKSTESSNYQLDSAQKEAFLLFIRNYFGTIFKLNQEGKNGIWNFLIGNSYRPGLVQDSFNGIVSNPPWLALSRIEDNPYKKHLSDLAEEMYIKPSGSSFLHTELATIFLLSSIKRYLKENSVIGCILPGTVLSGDHHTKFRDSSYLGYTEFKINQIWDLDRSIFKNRGIVVFGDNLNGETVYPIDALIDVTETNQRESRLYLSELDSKNTWTENQQSTNISNSYVKDFTQGADIMPRSLYFHELQPINHGNYLLSPIDRQSSDFAYLIKDSKKFSGFSISECQVESEVVFPVVISNILIPFHMSSAPLAVLPIKKHSGEWKTIEDHELMLMSNGFKRLVSRASKMYSDSANVYTLFDELNVRNKLQNQKIDPSGYIVFAGTGGEYVCANFISPEEEDFSRLVIDQTVNFYQVESKQEAIYLTGLLNSPSLSNAIRSFQAEGNFGARHIHSLPYRFIPKFDDTNQEHLAVVSATEQLQENIEELFSSTQDPKTIRLRIANESSIAFKRRKMRELMQTLPAYENYINACNKMFI